MFLKIKGKSDKKYGFKRERAMWRYSTQEPMQRNIDAGKSVGESVADATSGHIS